MKLILSSIVALSVIAAAHAQEESATPAASAEENSATSMQAPSSLRDTSTPTPAPEAKPSATAPAAVETTKASASASASPAATKKSAAAAEASEDESSTSTKTATAAATTGPDKGSPESNVKRLENEWEAAVMKHDAGFIDTRVAKDFIGVSSRGKRLNKSALMKEFKSDTDTYASAKNSGITVRAVEKNVVVASGTAKEVGKTKTGNGFNRSYLWTDTWVLRGDHWQCVASQVMLAPGRE